MNIIASNGAAILLRCPAVACHCGGLDLMEVLHGNQTEEVQKCEARFRPHHQVTESTACARRCRYRQQGGAVMSWGMKPKGKSRKTGQPSRKTRVAKPSKPEKAMVPGLNVRKAIDVKPKKVRWLWEPWFSRGKISLIAGEPGLGKSQIALGMAATVSTGGSWPCETGSCHAGDVVMVSVEDDAADTVRPRLDAAGADLERVHLINSVEDEGGGTRPFSVVTDLDRLAELLGKLKKPRLVIIDPLNACMVPGRGKRFSPNNVTDVRALLSRIERIALQHRVAIVCVTHFTKTKGGGAMAKITGSFAFVAAVRSAFTVTRDPRDQERRIFTPAKNNLGADTAGLAFRVQPKTTAGGIPSSVLSWERHVSASSPTARSDIDDAAELIGLALEDRKEIRAEDLFKLGAAQGFSKKQVRKAAARVGYTSEKRGWGKSGYWVYANPKPNADAQGQAGSAPKDPKAPKVPDDPRDTTEEPTDAEDDWS